MSATAKIRSQLSESCEKQKELACEISTLKVCLFRVLGAHRYPVQRFYWIKSRVREFVRLHVIMRVYTCSNNYPKLRNACKLRLD